MKSTGKSANNPTEISKRGGRRPGAGRKPKAHPDAGRPVGAPPAAFSGDAKRAWRDLVKSAAPGRLWRHHRTWLEGTAQLLARLRDDDWSGSPSDLSRMQSALARLGLVP